MSRSAAERVATHGAIGVVLGVLLYVVLSLTSIISTPEAKVAPDNRGNGPSPAGTGSEAAALPPPGTDTPLAAPRPVPYAPSPVPASTSVPPRKFRVGIQVGHWLTDEVPDELEKLSTVEGVKADDLDETVICMQVAQQLSGLLAEAGIQSEILPTTVPEGYSAHLFLALHADAFKEGWMRGFKVARSTWSDDPERDDELVDDLRRHYTDSTGLPENVDTITDAMTEYYVFNYSKFSHAISPTTPGAIIELGFLSNEEDRHVLVEEQHLMAVGIANAIRDFLERLP